MLLHGHAALPSSRPHVAAGVQPDVAEDGRAGGTHRGADRHPSVPGLRRGSRLTCAGNNCSVTRVITLTTWTPSAERERPGPRGKCDVVTFHLLEPKKNLKISNLLFSTDANPKPVDTARLIRHVWFFFETSQLNHKKG